MNPLKINDSTLPASLIADDVYRALESCGKVVVTAPPGAGKSTLLPLTILNSLKGGGKVLMLEPRRMAARQIACRMSEMIGENAGGTVGYRVRFESCVSRSTRIEVLTEGILARMLVDDPTLDGVDVIIFDEFHERSLVCDEAFAMTLRTRALLRPDLKIAVMSATMDADAVCRHMDAVHVSCGGRMFPVEVVYSARPPDPRDIAGTVCSAVRDAHRAHHGDILVFLPGESEIKRCTEALEGTLGPATDVFPLYGMLSPGEQHAAISPSPAGRRKVVLSTNIAETSLTIEGVRVVIDSGLCRRMIYDPRTALSRLETVRISRDMAEQRSGRAGRLAPGVCYRLWDASAEARMEQSRTPEILEADLSPLFLDIACWGGSTISELPWLTAPDSTSVEAASELLSSLGALGLDSMPTSVGKSLYRIPCHPRLARMLLTAKTPGQKSLACDIAAVLEEKDPLGVESVGADISLRVSALRRASGSGMWGRIERTARQYRKITTAGADCSAPDPYECGALLAAAYPDRVAKAWADSPGSFMLTGGGIVEVDAMDPLSSCEWIAVASTNAHPGARGRVFLAAPLDIQDMKEHFTVRETLSWDSALGRVSALRETRFGCLTVDAVPSGNVSRGAVDAVIAQAARKEGRSMLDFSEAVSDLQRRVAFVASRHPELNLPDLSTDAVLSCASEWLPPFLGKATSVAELKKIDMAAALWSILDYQQQNAVERFAPSHVTVPTGSRIRLEYRQGSEAPVLRVRLQECFGLTVTPRVDDGHVPVLMELLSPGFKPVQLTSDLESFWSSTYFEVRKELRRRYPKHSWPDNPLEAPAVRGTARKKTE